MVLPDSHEIPRAPCYSGTRRGSRAGFAYRTVTVCGLTFQIVPLPARFITSCRLGRDGRAVPLPPARNACRLSHAQGLASSPFAHHYSGNRGCFLFLRVLRCFTSPRYHHPPYAFRRRRHPMTGARFPHSETPGSQPGCRLPGEYRRLQRPSSAPGAKASTVCPKKLGTTKTLQTFCFAKKQEMLASTVQFSRNGQKPGPGQDIRPAGAPARKEETSRPQGRLFPQDPTVCPPGSVPAPPFRSPANGERTNQKTKDKTRRIASAPLESMRHPREHPPRAAPGAP